MPHQPTQMSIDAALYFEFCAYYHKGTKYRGMRFGQAFSIHFELHKSNDERLKSLFYMDDKDARKLISELIDLTPGGIK